MNTKTSKPAEPAPKTASVDGKKAAADPKPTTPPTAERLKPTSLNWNDHLWQILQSLPNDETRGKFINATLEYFFKDVEPNLKNDPVLQVVFNLARQEIDKQIDEYSAKTAHNTAEKPTANDGKQRTTLKEIAERIEAKNAAKS